MIEISNLSKSFNDHMVLEGVGTKIEKGSICGLIGSNGAGKSTLLRCVSGVYKPQEGEVRIDGEPVYENADAKQKLFFLADEAYFRGVKTDGFTVVWPNGQDLCPDELYTMSVSA